MGMKNGSQYFVQIIMLKKKKKRKRIRLAEERGDQKKEEKKMAGIRKRPTKVKVTGMDMNQVNGELVKKVGGKSRVETVEKAQDKVSGLETVKSEEKSTQKKETVKSEKKSKPEKETVKKEKKTNQTKVRVENEKKPIQTKERVKMKKKPVTRVAIKTPPKKNPKRRDTIHTEAAMRGYVASGRVSQERYDQWDAARKKPLEVPTDEGVLGRRKDGADPKEEYEKSRSELEKKRDEVSNSVQVNRKQMEEINEKRVTRTKEDGGHSEEAKQMKNEVKTLEARYMDLSRKRRERTNENDKEKIWVFGKHPSVIDRRKKREEKRKNEKK